MIQKMKYLLAFGIFLLSFVLLKPVSIHAQAADVGGSSKDIELNVSTRAIVVDSTYELKVYNVSDSYKVSFKTDASDVASVNKDGVISAKKVGTATITVTVRDGFKTITSLDCNVIVGPPAFTIKLTKEVITISVGKRTTIKGILKPENTVETPIYSSADLTIATVSSTGTIKGIKAGETYVYAKLENGKSDFCKVIVTDQKGSDDED